jgi:hypothetical protein
MNPLEELHRKGEQRAGWYLLSASLLAGVIWLVPVLWSLGSQDYSVQSIRSGILLLLGLPLAFLIPVMLAPGRSKVKKGFVFEFVGIVLILPMCFVVLTWMATKNFLVKQRLLK